MCPVCFATAAWIAAGITSTGGMSALVVSRLRGNDHPLTNNKYQQKGEEDGQRQ